MNNKILYASRQDLMKAIFEANRMLVSLGWAVEDGKATRDDVLNVAGFLADATQRNSRDTLEEMSEVSSVN
jgi:hypothetical protein